MACSKSGVGSLQLLPKSSVRMNIQLITCVALVGAVLLPAVVAAVDGPTHHHLHFYMHEKEAGPNITAVLVVNCTGPRLPAARGLFGCFGDTRVVDDVLTAEPNLTSSRVVGRVQGSHVMASGQGDPVLVMSLTVVLTDYPPYAAGSTVVVVGRNKLQAPVRELPVVGGTGSFRMAVGYVLLKTKSLSSDFHDALLEVDVFLRT